MSRKKAPKPALNRIVAGHLYLNQPLTVDQLPYTPELSQITHRYNVVSKQSVSERDVYLCIQNLRKSGAIPKKISQKITRV